MKLRQIEYALGIPAVLAVLGIILWIAFTIGAGGAVIVLETTPNRASAYIDGHFVGTTPTTVQRFPPGTHVLRVTKFGHVPLLRELDVRTGKNTLKFNLAELPGGTLDIKSVPPGAEVFVNGESCGHTPRSLTKLGTGGHRVRLSLVNYLDWKKTVNIEENKTVELNVTLRTRTGAHYIDAIKADPKNAVLLVDLAHYYITRSEWKEAEDAFTKALILTATTSPGYSSRLQQELHKVFGGTFKYDDRKRGQEVIVNSLVRAIKACPNHVRYYSHAVNYNLKRGLTDKAQEILELGILAFPYNRNWTVNALRGRFGRHGNPDRMLRTIEQRLEKNPGDFVSHFQHMTIMRQKGNTDEVIKEYEHLARLAKSARVKAKLLSDMGRMWERKGNYEKAAEAYRRAVKTETSKKEAVPVQYNLVRVLGQLKRREEALAAWEKAVGLQDNVEVACRWRIEWASLAVKMKKHGKARTILGDVLKLSKDENTRSRAREILKEIRDK